MTALSFTADDGVRLAAHAVRLASPAFRALAPQLRVETVAGAGHMRVGDQKDASAAVLMRFLDEAMPA